MSRIRTIKPEFFTSADICALPPLARLLYVALWCEADREGRFVWNPRTFKLRYLPDDKCDINELCSLLLNAGLVAIYEINGEKLACIPTFTVHQQINNRESASRLPEPPDDVTRQARVRHASEHIDDAAKPPLVRKGRERKGTLSYMPENFSIPEEWIGEAKKKNPFIDWKAEASRFVSHHRSKASQFHDWKSAWWTWVNAPYEKTKSRDPPNLALSGFDETTQDLLRSAI